MLDSHQVEELIRMVAALDKPALVEQFQTYHASFPIDFTREFLESQPTDRLRHLLRSFARVCRRPRVEPRSRPPRRPAECACDSQSRIRRDVLLGWAGEESGRTG